jgi:putative flippase GtrA
LDFAVFSIAFWTTGSLAIAVTTGRVASLVNFYLNRRLVFRASNGLGAALTRYYALTALLAFASYLGIRFLSSRAGVPVLAAKVVVDTTLWFVNFSFQRAFVFRGESVEPEA